MNILVVEDNPEVAAVIEMALNAQGFTVDVAHEGCEGEEMAACRTQAGKNNGAGKYDVILLDVMLPDRSGIDICRNLRRRGVHSRVLMVSGLASTADKVRALDSGADDYITKPFEFDEMLARVRALGRQGLAKDSRWLRCDDLELDLYSRTAKRDGRAISLQNREFSLLEYFMRNPDRVLSHANIGEGVWGAAHLPGDNLVAVYVGCLRKRLDIGQARPFIRTFRGVGYRFDTSLEPASTPTGPAAPKRSATNRVDSKMSTSS